MAMCIGSENWFALDPEQRRKIVYLIRHVEEGMTTPVDLDTLHQILAEWLDFCDPADVAEFIVAVPEYDEEERENTEVLERLCQD